MSKNQFRKFKIVNFSVHTASNFGIRAVFRRVQMWPLNDNFWSENFVYRSTWKIIQFRDLLTKFWHRQALSVFRNETRFLRFWVIFWTFYLRNEFDDLPIFFSFLTWVSHNLKLVTGTPIHRISTINTMDTSILPRTLAPYNQKKKKKKKKNLCQLQHVLYFSTIWWQVFLHSTQFYLRNFAYRSYV